jgi:cytochrome P450
MEESFMEFGGGPRICPGMILATQEILLATIGIAYTFDLELACPVEEIYRESQGTLSANKMPVRITKVLR